MVNNKIEKKLAKDAATLQFQIEHRKLYNVHTALVRLLLKSGLVLDKSMPFLLSSVLVLNSSHFKNNKPFKKDIVLKPGYIQYVDMSNGTHQENIRAIRKKNYIEYSTGWYINNTGIYERTIVSYEVNSKLNSKSLDDVLCMTKEELEELLEITDVRIITKEVLTKEDEMYKEDVVIVNQYVKTKDTKVLRQETNREYYSNMLMYIFTVLLYGSWFKTIKKFLIKTIIEDKLNNTITTYRCIHAEELEDLKKNLEIKQSNLEMLQDKTQENSKSLCKTRKR